MFQFSSTLQTRPSHSCILLRPTYALTVRLPHLMKRMCGVSPPLPQKHYRIDAEAQTSFSVFTSTFEQPSRHKVLLSGVPIRIFSESKEKRAYFLVSCQIVSAYRLRVHFRNTVMQSSSGNSRDGIFSDTGIWIRSYNHLLKPLPDLRSVTIDSSIKAPNGWVRNFKA